MTVTGPVAADRLGVTLPHEHIFINMLREYRGDGFVADEGLATSEVAAFWAAGGGTIVDVTTIGLWRKPEALRRISETTGVKIVMGTGYYRELYQDRPALDRASVNQLADGLVRDIEVGIDGTDVRAGIIGELACDEWLTAIEERCFRAAARAHLQTGLTLSTHAARWPVGLAQLDLFESEGVDPGRVIVGHCDLVADPDYHLAVARRGAWVQFDCIQGRLDHETKQAVGYVLALLEAGFSDRILLSHDVCLRSNLAALGGCGYTYVPTGFRDELLAAGVLEAMVDGFLIDNPRRALTGT
ncbi:MAG: phosphotriesterase-related protein [Candidatus Limnocylindrales bacterium]